MAWRGVPGSAWVPLPNRAIWHPSRAPSRPGLLDPISGPSPLGSELDSGLGPLSLVLSTLTLTGSLLGFTQKPLPTFENYHLRCHMFYPTRFCLRDAGHILPENVPYLLERNFRRGSCNYRDTSLNGRPKESQRHRAYYARQVTGFRSGTLQSLPKCSQISLLWRIMPGIR